MQGITQAELGRRIGQRQTFISTVDSMEHRLDVAELIDICRAIPTDPIQPINKAKGG